MTVIVETPDKIEGEGGPRPPNKQVFAEMTRFREGEVINGQVQCFARLAWSALHVWEKIGNRTPPP